MHIKQSFYAMAVVAVLLVGCGQAPRTHSSSTSDGQLTQVPDYAASQGIAAQLMVREGLKGLSVIDLRSQRRNDLLTVQAEVINTSRSDRQLYFRFRWLDRDGAQVGNDEAWKPMQFLGLQNQYIKGSATRSQAVDFRIELSATAR